MKRHNASGRGAEISPAEYRALADFRYQIRRFLHFSEHAVRAAGLEPQQHQLLLAAKALGAESAPTIGHIAERLQIRHHSAVELVDRSVASGLIRRLRSPHDRRQVLVELTPKGERLLRRLTLHHRGELGRSARGLVRSLAVLLRARKRSRPASAGTQ